jgi:glycosyltransferase involved in cell wall biosynthesis
MISLIIAVYKKLDFLELVFESINNQTFKDFEVIIAEDAEDPATLNFLIDAQKKYLFNVKHVFQKDIGFRKTIILNKALLVTKGEKLVFIDGDCILHKRFLESYQKNISSGIYYFGRRYHINEKITLTLLNKRSIKGLNGLFNLVNLAFSNMKDFGNAVYIPFKRIINNQHRQIWGCNWGIMKSDLLKINGFDEDYVESCAGEDTDVDWRLKRIGLEIRSLKNQAIMYHLYHAPNHDHAGRIRMETLMLSKISQDHFYCDHGIGFTQD